MYLYRFEVEIPEKTLQVVVVTSHDEEAFHLVEEEVENYYLKMPEIKEITLYEKKRISSGAGYVLAAG